MVAVSKQEFIPCAIMRGGTSKGIYFLLDDLPTDEATRNQLILSLIGGDARQVNGIGGGDMLNSKVALVSKAKNNKADIEYRFIQVVPGENRIDTAPTCGNILAGVGAFAIEKGLITAQEGETNLTIYDVNTGTYVEQIVQTPAGKVIYGGECVIAGAPGKAAPVLMYYLNFTGAKTGKLFPTGNSIDTIEGMEVSCLDAAMPIVLFRAKDLGVRGTETDTALDNNSALKGQLAKLRLVAAKKMGMGDVRDQVIPKVALVCKPCEGGTICSRYFTPHTAHAAYAVSGGIALATAVLSPGTIAYQAANPPSKDDNGDHLIDIEHPSGMMRVMLKLVDNKPQKAGTVRTTRLIMSGQASLGGL